MSVFGGARGAAEVERRLSSLSPIRITTANKVKTVGGHGWLGLAATIRSPFDESCVACPFVRECQRRVRRMAHTGLPPTTAYATTWDSLPNAPRELCNNTQRAAPVARKQHP